MHVPSIGNGLWWLARRRMSAQRLAENRIAVERKIGTFTQPYAGFPWKSLFGFGLVSLAILSVPNYLPEWTRPTAPPTPDYELTKAPSQLNAWTYIRLRQKPLERQPIKYPVLEQTTAPERVTDLKVRPLEALPESPSNRSARTRLSDLLHQFAYAKEAQAQGHLEEAKSLFLTIARSGQHPALGQESYLRALEIAYRLQHKVSYEALEAEALEKWPRLEIPFNPDSSFQSP